MIRTTIWGSRGSIPVSGASFARYGGATTCLEIERFSERGSSRNQKTTPDAASERVIIDCGTGLASLGREWSARKKRALFLQTHFHWDHLQGFPFFGPLYDPAASFEFWAAPRDGHGAQALLGGQMKPPNFPVQLEHLPSSLMFRDLAHEGSRRHEGLDISWADMSHPSGSSAFRVEAEEGAVVFSGDVEVAEGSRAQLIALARGAQVLIMDAQYFPEEYPSKRGFGHSTPIEAVEVALAAGVKQLVLTHHDPTHDDARLDEKLALAQEAAGDRLIVRCACDGLQIHIGDPHQAQALESQHAQG